MSPGERERIIERLIGRLILEGGCFEVEGCQEYAAMRRMEVRALEDLRHVWADWPDHLVGRRS